MKQQSGDMCKINIAKFGQRPKNSKNNKKNKVGFGKTGKTKIRVTAPQSAWRSFLVAKEIRKLRNLTTKFRTIDRLEATEYMERFDAAAKKHRFKKTKLSEGRAVYRLGNGSIRIAIISGIHGEERAGPIALLSWLEMTRKEYLIPEHVSLMICPLVGHDAWNNREREENGTINLNEVWARKQMLPSYISELKVQLQSYKPSIFVDIHEDSTIEDNEPYLFRERRVNGIIKKLQKALGVSPLKGLWKNPEYRGTSETFVFRNGCLETTTIETPQTKVLKSRVGFNLAALKWIVNVDEDAINQKLA